MFFLEVTAISFTQIIFELDDRVIMKPLEKAVVLEQNKVIH